MMKSFESRLSGSEACLANFAGSESEFALQISSQTLVIQPLTRLTALIAQQSFNTKVMGSNPTSVRLVAAGCPISCSFSCWEQVRQNSCSGYCRGQKRVACPLKTHPVAEIYLQRFT